MHLFPIKRLLVCTDLSESSDKVVRAAEELKVRNNCQVDYLFVSELPFHLGDVLKEGLKGLTSETFFEDLTHTYESRLKLQLKRCEAHGKIIIKEGRIYQEILNLANSGDYDLLVMGHGQSSVLHQIVGSNAFKVITSCRIPLFILKSQLKWDKVVGLVDDSPEAEGIIIGTYDFTKNFKFSSTEFLSVWFDIPEPFGSSQKGFELEEKLKEKVAFYADESRVAKVRVEPTRELQIAYHINDLLKDRSISTIALKRSSNHTSKFYIGSTTKRLTEIFLGNLLIFPATKDAT